MTRRSPGHAEPPPFLGAARWYSATSLSVPTALATVLLLFELPGWTLLSLAAGTVLLLLAWQQLGWLRAAGHLRSFGGTLPAWARGRTALVAGTLIACCAAFVCVHAGKPAMLWALAPAAPLGVLSLETVRWRGDAPAWSVHDRAVLLVLGALAATTLGLAEHYGTRPGSVLLAVAASLAASTVAVLVQIGQVWWEKVVVELHRSRATIAAQTLEAERLRFAGELHDIQGAELQRIMVQADLAQALLATGRAEAVEQAADTVRAIRSTAQDALKQARAIAHGYRRTSLAQELTNAVEMLTSTGAHVEVEGEPDTEPDELSVLAGFVVRECTTNILRHSEARAVRFVLLRDSERAFVQVTDHGPRRTSGIDSDVPSSGLTDLRRRVEAAGGTLTWGPRGNGWQTTMEHRGTGDR